MNKQFVLKASLMFFLSSTQIVFEIFNYISISFEISLSFGGPIAKTCQLKEQLAFYCALGKLLYSIEWTAKGGQDFKKRFSKVFVWKLTDIKLMFLNSKSVSLTFSDLFCAATKSNLVNGFICSLLVL